MSLVIKKAFAEKLANEFLMEIDKAKFIFVDGVEIEQITIGKQVILDENAKIFWAVLSLEYNASSVNTIKEIHYSDVSGNIIMKEIDMTINVSIGKNLIMHKIAFAYQEE